MKKLRTDLSGRPTPQGLPKPKGRRLASVSTAYISWARHVIVPALVKLYFEERLHNEKARG